MNDRRKHNFAILTASTMLTGCAATRPAAQRAAYEGWPDAIHLTNGTVDVVVVPSIGRIVRYGYVGGPNLLWSNPSLAGQTAATQPGKWANFGGEKVYPWPQADWTARFGHDWPPPPGVDPLAYHCTIEPDGSLRMTSDVLPAFGVRIVRHIRVAAADSALTIDTEFEQVEPTSSDWPIAVWSVAQWRLPESIMARRTAAGHGLMLTPLRGTFSATQPLGCNAIVMQPPVGDVAKVAADADMLILALDGMSVIEHASNDRGRLDDSADRAQVYCTPYNAKNPAAAYVELEFTSPRRRLAVGERLSLRVTWRLLRSEHLGDDEMNAIAAIDNATRLSVLP